MSGLNGVASGAESTSTPAIVTSAGDALAANPNRCGLIIQNLGQNPLFIRFGDTASTSVFNVVLAAGTADDDGTAGSLTIFGGVVPTGNVSVAGASPRCVVTELIE